jgi:endoglucanase
MTLSVKVSGNKLIDGNGNPLQLRGVNISSLEFNVIRNATPVGAAVSPFDYWGGQMLYQAGASGPGPDNGVPDLADIAAWAGVNALRIPLNAQCYLGQTCYNAAASAAVAQQAVVADPMKIYPSVVKAIADAATAAGLYVIFDLHFTAPPAVITGLTTTPLQLLSNSGGQPEMADTSSAIPFWSAMANAFKGYPNVLFDLFNEPHIDNFSTYTAAANPGTTIPAGTSPEEVAGWSILRDGGTGNLIYGDASTFTQSYASAGMQAMLNAIRAAGATNVVLAAGISWAQDQSLWLQFAPTDPLKQLACSWHAYPSSSAPSQPGFPNNFIWASAILAAGYPIIIGETGDTSAAPAQWFPTLLPWADTNNVSVLAWSWNAWGAGNDDLITNINGTPTAGEGASFKAWAATHTGATTVSTTQNEVGTITYASQAGFAAGSVVDHINITITGKISGNTTPQSFNFPPGTPAATMPNLTPDTYTFTIQGMPASGAGFGTPLTKDANGNSTFTVTAVQTSISLSLPSAVSFTQP